MAMASSFGFHFHPPQHHNSCSYSMQLIEMIVRFGWIDPISRTFPNWFGANWAGQSFFFSWTRGKILFSGGQEAHEASQGPEAEVETNSECRLTVAQYSLQWGRAWESDFIGRVREKRNKMGVKWVHFQGRMDFQGRMVLRRLLTVTPFTLLTLVTDLRVKTIERCESGFK